jgi:hypothetical protein
VVVINQLKWSLEAETVERKDKDMDLWVTWQSAKFSRIA